MLLYDIPQGFPKMMHTVWLPQDDDAPPNDLVTYSSIDRLTILEGAMLTLRGVAQWWYFRLDWRYVGYGYDPFETQSGFYILNSV